MPKIRVLLLDWDGVVVDTFRGPLFILRLKRIFFQRFRRLFFLSELAEYVLGISWPLHPGSRELVAYALSHLFKVGVLTDRSLFGLTKSANRVGLGINAFHFVHARAGLLDRFASVPRGTFVFRTPAFKYEPKALSSFMGFLARENIRPSEVLLVGDDFRDEKAAEQNGFYFLKVDPSLPNFAEVYEYLK